MSPLARLGAVASLALALAPPNAGAALPRELARAFLDAGVPLTDVGIVVQETRAGRPLFSHQAEQPMNPASVMKLVTTFAALELLGRDHRWRTEAYLGGPLRDGTLEGDLVLKGGGDPKITIEQWTSFVAALRERGLERIRGDLVLDRTFFAPTAYDPAAFDREPLKPYNVGPDAMLVNFKTVRFRFVPTADGAGVDVVAEPPLPQLAIGAAPQPVDGPCGDWRTSVAAAFIAQSRVAAASFPGRYPRDCGERDWYLALLDGPNYAHGMFASAFAAAGGEFGGAVREGRAPAGAAPFAVLESLPLYEVVRDINKLSSNVMARQVFLTLATASAPPPATIDKAQAAVARWLAKRRLALPELVIENGSGLSRAERISAGSLARLLVAAYRSSVMPEFIASLPLVAYDGTLRKRMKFESVAGQAHVKTGSLSDVRSIAGYVLDRVGRRHVVVMIVNHPNAPRAQAAQDALLAWVYENGAPAERRPPAHP